jgi:hypothetical protein
VLWVYVAPEAKLLLKSGDRRFPVLELKVLLLDGML